MASHSYIFTFLFVAAMLLLALLVCIRTAQVLEAYVTDSFINTITPDALAWAA